MVNIEKNLKTISYKDYCKSKGYKYKIVEKEYKQEVYIPRYFEYSLERKAISDVIYPEIYVCELEKVNIIGTNNFVFDDDYCIYDMPFRDEENKFFLKSNNTKFPSKVSTDIHYNTSLNQKIREGIMLLSSASYNYYHFNIELMTKLCLINKIKEYRNTPLILDKRVQEVPQFKDEIDKLNIYNREIIYVEEGYVANVERLICIGDLSILPVNIIPNTKYKYEDCITSKLGVDLLNENLALQGTPIKKLFISRRNSKFKRLTNQEEVEEIFENFGFEIIFPEEMSFDQQLEIFSHADIIAGVSGSGLSNIIFSNKDTKLVCIYTKDIEIASYSNLAGILDRKYYFLDASINNLKENDKYYYCKGTQYLDIDYLIRFLNIIL